MSKIEDGKVVLEHKPFSIIDAIDEVLVIGRLRAPEFGVTIESIGVKDLVHTDVIGSPDHVRRVLLNLVDNAGKYNRLGGTVRCAVDELGVKGNTVTYRFVVSDTCAANGREAFDTFVERPAGSFDAILMDIMMPVMDGYDAARAIRRSVKADAGPVPIFAMTANAFAEDAQRAHDAGMNGHLTKPIDMEKVKQALATARR